MSATVTNDHSLWRLKISAFVCGAVLMALEMAGVRILNVFFGSTIYVWGAIIGVFLGALSLGYYLGGILADRHPSYKALAGLILLSALFIFIASLLARPVCLALLEVHNIGPRLQSLLASMVLYFIPSVLMGCVSPYTVRLAARELHTMGKVAGRFYAISTLGSIFGTFLTSFLLIELIGNRVTLWSLGIVLILIALLLFSKRNFSLSSATALFMGIAFGIGSYFAIGGPLIQAGERHILEEFDSAYHHIVIADGYSMVRGSDAKSRFLMFNNQSQSGVELGENNVPVRDGQTVTACGYTDMLHMGILFRPEDESEWPKNCLFIGCGGGIGPMVFNQDYPQLKRIDVVDIDPAVFRMAQKYFNYPADNSSPVIKSYALDGRRFVRTAESKYDYVVLDAYSSGGRIPFHLLTREFLQNVKEKLSNHGVLVINLISAIEGKKSRLCHAVLKTLNEVFPGKTAGQVYAFPRSGYSQPEELRNICIVCTVSGERKKTTDLLDKAQRFYGSERLKRPGLLGFAETLLPSDTGLSDGVLLTDDFAPTDSMVCF